MPTVSEQSILLPVVIHAASASGFICRTLIDSPQADEFEERQFAGVVVYELFRVLTTIGRNGRGWSERSQRGFSLAFFHRLRPGRRRGQQDESAEVCQAFFALLSGMADQSRELSAHRVAGKQPGNVGLIPAMQANRFNHLAKHRRKGEAAVFRGRTESRQIYG